MKAFETGDTVTMNSIMTDILNESDEFIKNNFIKAAVSKSVSMDVALALIQQAYYGSLLNGEQKSLEKLEYYKRIFTNEKELNEASYYATHHDEDFSVFMGY
jgi:hypothetical protein